MDVGNLISGSSAFLNPDWKSGSSRFTYCWSLAWRILSITLLRVRWVQLCSSLNILWHCLSLGLQSKLSFSSPVATAEFSKFAVYCFISVQSLSRVQLFVTSWTAAQQASLSFTISQSLLKLMSIESVMSSNHLILCGLLLLQPSIFPSIRVFTNESALRIRWPNFSVRNR